MISDGNILRLLYFLFFILSSWLSIPCPSFNHTLINLENFLDVFCRGRTIFWSPVSIFYILRVARLLSLLFVFKFCFSHVTVSAPAFLANTLSIKFSWWRGRGVRGAFYTFSSFLSWVGHRGGMGRPVCIKCLFFDDEVCTLQKVGG